MIEARELRIGNIVSARSGHYGAVTNIYPSAVMISGIKTSMRVDRLLGIPITEERLIAFGFFKFNNAWVLQEPTNGIGFHFSIWYDLTYNTAELRPKLDYVHQLQNCFYCLCGKELQMQNLY